MKASQTLDNEVGISHVHLRCSRSSGCNEDAFGRNDTITPYINLCRVSFSFAFFNTAKESSKLRQCWGAEIADLIKQGLSPRHSPWCR